MRKASAGCRFVFVGQGPLLSALRQWQPDCVFAGAVPHEELGRYFASADVYIHASQSETFGNVVLEGLSSGLAFAGFDYAAAGQFVTDRESGLLVPCDQPENLVNAAVELSTDKALRQRLRQGAVAAVTGQFWTAVARKFALELQEVSAGNGV
jgi:glycosyltransferase involved in cell wall biosynthesis